VLQILDGRNRYNAAIEISYRWRVEDFRVFNGSVEEARKFASELNDIRRHLSAEQRKEKAAKLIAANPGLSSRALAAMCGISHTTIVRMREQTSDQDKSYDAFVNKWASLSLAHQERFVREHRIDLTEFLRITP
jgi:predicted HTH transcriptional regulator